MGASPTVQSATREANVRSLLVLLALCLLWSLGVLREDLPPNLFSAKLTWSQRELFPLCMLALAAGITAVLRKDVWPRGAGWATPALIGLGLFAAPAFLLQAAEGALPSLTRAALLSLVPVFAVVLEPHLRGEALSATSCQPRMALPAALGAVAGTLLVFPVELPTSAQAAGGFCGVVLAGLCIAAGNCWAVKVATPAERQTNTLVPFVVIATATPVLVFGAVAILNPKSSWQPIDAGPELAWSAAVELPALLLLFWLMPRMSAARMSTRYLFALLLPVLLGSAIFQIPLAARTIVGLLLMSTGAGYLLLAPTSSPEPPGLSLR